MILYFLFIIYHLLFFAFLGLTSLGIATASRPIAHRKRIKLLAKSFTNDEVRDTLTAEINHYNTPLGSAQMTPSTGLGFFRGQNLGQSQNSNQNDNLNQNQNQSRGQIDKILQTSRSTSTNNKTEMKSLSTDVFGNEKNDKNFKSNDSNIDSDKLNFNNLSNIKIVNWGDDSTECSAMERSFGVVPELPQLLSLSQPSSLPFFNLPNISNNNNSNNANNNDYNSNNSGNNFNNYNGNGNNNNNDIDFRLLSSSKKNKINATLQEIILLSDRLGVESSLLPPVAPICIRGK